MQFLVTGKDGKDAEALDRRMKARPAHLANAEAMKLKGQLLMGAALLDEGKKMIGSIMILNFDDRAEVDKYLAAEPYVCGDVWQEIHVQDIAVGAHFMPELVQK